LSSPPSERTAVTNDAREPINRFSGQRLTRREKVVKQEIDAYHVSEVDDTAVIYVGDEALSIYRSLELPDAECHGLTYKQRLISTESGNCMLIARWKPDRQMRRMAPDWSQKWFVEKELFPPDPDRLFTRVEKRLEQAGEEEQSEAGE
jgi:hypothetical protein